MNAQNRKLAKVVLAGRRPGKDLYWQNNISLRRLTINKHTTHHINIYSLHQRMIWAVHLCTPTQMTHSSPAVPAGNFSSLNQSRTGQLRKSGAWIDSCVHYEDSSARCCTFQHQHCNTQSGDATQTESFHKRQTNNQNESSSTWCCIISNTKDQLLSIQHKYDCKVTEDLKYIESLNSISSILRSLFHVSLYLQI